MKKIQKLKICGINLTAYSVVLVIMLLLSVCSKSYGQENRVLSFDRAKQTVTGIDTTKLSVYEHEKAFLSPHFDTIPQMPGTLLDFRPDYTQSFPVDRSSLHKGEYNVGGIIHRFNKVDVWGRGRQENIIGVGVSNYAEVKTVYSPNEKWELGLCLYANKLSIPRSGSNTFGIGTDVSCQFLPKTSLHLFGTYYRTYFPGVKPMQRLDGYHYGGYLSFDLAERWAMDVGMRSYSGNGSHQQWTVPIIRPSYKHNGREINADFGGMFQQIVKGLFFNH
ncbi:hypothetical protein [uncultured Bacteroides sp.]|uniref:hypothetical protein n=1 Tax=uncultured Bacteroides sp. TaxID=162156 RepID=UPI0023CC7C40|nr:hypothetical protein [uncultured Bacteroides sp.]MDE5760584.1 hypothetical protein [Bacteroides sp.]